MCVVIVWTSLIERDPVPADQSGTDRRKFRLNGRNRFGGLDWIGLDWIEIADWLKRD